MGRNHERALNWRRRKTSKKRTLANKMSETCKNTEGKALQNIFFSFPLNKIISRRGKEEKRVTIIIILVFQHFDLQLKEYWYGVTASHRTMAWLSSIPWPAAVNLSIKPSQERIKTRCFPRRPRCPCPYQLAQTRRCRPYPHRHSAPALWKESENFSFFFYGANM